MLNIIKVHRELTRRGVTGINGRNINFVLKHNPRRCYPLVDDKVTTKRIAIEAGVRVPEQYAVLEFQGHFDRLRDVAKQHREFVIKPARGSGGGGILVIGGVSPNGLRKASDSQMSWDEVRFHCNDIFGGMYSLGSGGDKILVEQRLHVHSAFKPISYRGVPDVRIIVFRGVPAMAMLRLPTSMSDGKANLHMGGVGAGIDLAAGVTTKAVCLGEQISHHPDFDTPLQGFEIPGWDEVLVMSAKLGQAVGLGYVGVDLVVDEDHGPTMLELNARPGIAIQVANGLGLLHPLKMIDQMAKIPADPKDRVALGIDVWAETCAPFLPARNPVETAAPVTAGADDASG